MINQVVINLNELTNLTSIGLFETKNPWYHVDRTLDIDKMLYVVNGVVTLCEEGIDYAIASNQVFFLKHRCRHWGKTEIEPGTKWFWVSFKPFQFKKGVEQYALPKQITVSSPAHLTTTLNTMLHLFNSSEPFKKERLNGYLYYILYQLLVQQVNNRSDKKAKTITDQVKNLLYEHLESPFSSQFIEESLNMNYSYIGRMFKSVTGTSINRYFNELKIQKATELMLLDTLNISKISESLGYPNPYYFSRVFKQVTGVSPKEYRRNLYIKYKKGITLVSQRNTPSQK
ncbi:helix-turn-helix domain-containing protein [Paenibacillus sp. oral taxon 786]|uniref:helix-turn-helix domain-containing protein n=1 Tax=Paenibacillus sp. oral taxon 786 TaxID=652715 RepID=UPI0002FDA865|nr:AraC family transcriptional regulator [Paenibacillus sp. oral taxon 786]